MRTLRHQLPFALILAIPVVHATDLSVCAHGCPFTTIQGAVDSAHPGDTINIGPGNYLENVRVAKALILNGAGRDKTRIEGGLRGTVFTLDSPSEAPKDMPVVISNLTITHGRGAGFGGGVEVIGVARLQMHACILVSNSSFGGTLQAGGAINIESVTAAPNKIVDTILAYNHSETGGGAVTVSFESSAQITSSTITRNDTAAQGGGILFLNKSVSSLMNSSVTENRAGQDGGGLSAAFRAPDNPAAVLSIDGSVIADNSSGSNGGGISGPATVSNSVIARNTATIGGGGWFTGGRPQLSGSFIVQNTAEQLGGGVLTLGPLSSTDTTVTHNHPDNCRQEPPSGSGCL